MTFDMVLFFISGGGFFTGLFAAVLAWSRSRGNQRANRLLALLLLLGSFNIVHPLVAMLAPRILSIRGSSLTEPMQFLMAPAIAAYLHALIRPDLKPRPSFLLHALPFAVMVCISLSPLPGILDRSTGLPLATAGLWALLVVQIFFYVVPLFGNVHRHRDALRGQLSNLSGVDLGWITWFMRIFAGLYLAYTLVLIFVIHDAPALLVRGFLSVALSAYVCALAYRGTLQRETPRLEELDDPAAPAAAKYQRGTIPPEEAREVQERLRRAMESDKLYLDPDLDLSALASRVGAARNQLSYVINQNFGKNFYDFVNEYRVREVLRLMEDGSRANDKMLTLAFDAGFNSKPTFNAVFKKITGRTPSDFRRSSRKVVLTNKKVV